MAATATLPIMNVTTDKPIPEDKSWVTGKGSLMDGSKRIFDGKLQIKGHGNYTWTLPKKPYNIKLDKKQRLFDMSEDKDWALMANFLDKTLISTALAMRVGQASTSSYALPWTPKSKFVDLTLNGNHVGVYQLMETIELSPERVNGTEVKGDTGLSSTGTYLMEINHQGHPHDITTTQGVTIDFTKPDNKDITTSQAAYIKGYIQDFENLLYSNDKAFPYRAKADLQSFATWYIIEELASNQDSTFNGSCKCYKSPDTATAKGVLHMGPLWDFDISFGNTVNEDHKPDEFYVRNTAGPLGQTAKWIIKMFDDPMFVDAVKGAWHDLKAHFITHEGAGLIAAMNDLTTGLGESAARDKMLWQSNFEGATSTWSWADTSPSYATKADWIKARVIFLNGQYGH